MEELGPQLSPAVGEGEQSNSHSRGGQVALHKGRM